MTPPYSNRTGTRSVHVTRVSIGKLLAVLFVCALTFPRSQPAIADEGGVSFWLPGQFGSFAAVPSAPGWALGAIYYHLAADASASKSFLIGGNVVAGLNARADLVFLAPTYTFAAPVLGGQAALGLIGAFGRMRGTGEVTFTDLKGGQLSISQADTVTSGSDLYPLGTVKWQRGKNNYLVYTLLGVPVGAYQTGRLANIGTNHWSIDAGGGYTYFDAQEGHEFSAVAGLTYNFENPDTHYRNGIDGHLDWAASQFLSEEVHVGIVGYFYRQLSGDSGSGARLGDFESRTNGIGPQVGYFFPVAGGKGYVNLKAYWEFDASHRAEGWNTWLTLAIPFGAAPR